MVGKTANIPRSMDPLHDAGGDMVTGPKPGDEDETTGTELSCIYDAWNRLTAVYDDADDDGGMDAGEEIGKYEYDGLHRRIVKLDKSGLLDATYDYYYNTSWPVVSFVEPQVLYVERDVSGITIPLKAYVWGLRYIDAPIVRFRNADGGGGMLEEDLYYTSDANFNVTALVDPSDGSVVERYTYDPYGQPTVLDADWSDDADGDSDVFNEILYCGYRYDPETGLYHVRHRPYHPTLGRWPVQDFEGYSEGCSLYEYARSSATSYSDPLGLEAKCLSAPEVKRVTERARRKWRRRLKKYADYVHENYGGNAIEALGDEEAERLWLKKLAGGYIYQWWRVRERRSCSERQEGNRRAAVHRLWWDRNNNVLARRNMRPAIRFLQVLSGGIAKKGKKVVPGAKGVANTLPYVSGAIERGLALISEKIENPRPGQAQRFHTFVEIGCYECKCAKRTGQYQNDRYRVKLEATTREWTLVKTKEFNLSEGAPRDVLLIPPISDRDESGAAGYHEDVNRRLQDIVASWCPQKGG